jgi:PAS domain S-box-containing protein
MSIVSQDSCIVSAEGTIIHLGEGMRRYMTHPKLGIHYSEGFSSTMSSMVQSIMNSLDGGLDGDCISREEFVNFPDATRKIRITGYNCFEDEVKKISLIINNTSEEELIDLRSALSLPSNDHLVEDITELQEKVKNLEFNQANLNAILNNNLQLMLLLDLDKNVLSFNETANKVSRVFWQRDMVKGMSMSEFIPSNIWSKFEYYFEQASRGFAQYPGSQKAYDNRGNEYFFYINYLPVFSKDYRVQSVVVTLLDITEKVQSERKLINNTATFNAVVKESIISLFVCDWDMRILEHNEAAHKLFLLTINPKTSFMFSELVSDEVMVNRMRNELISVGRFVGEMNASRMNGEEFPIEVSAVVSNDILSSAQRIFILVFDISERKNHEKEREMLIQELTKSNTELKQFSYITSHNMRAPLTNMLTILDLIDRSTVNSEETLEMLDAMESATNHLNETLNDLIQILIVKGNSSIQCIQLDLRESLQTVEKSIASIIDESQTRIETSFEVPSVLFDPKYLESIFLNLITNSIKYSRKGIPPTIFIRSYLDKDEVVLVFQDNGRGFDMEKVKNRIFGLYQRFHNNSDSKGVGLYLVHSQITSLGGSIDVQSEVDKGTTFTLRFKNKKT